MKVYIKGLQKKIDNYLKKKPFSLANSEKEKIFLDIIKNLTYFHVKLNKFYSNFFQHSKKIKYLSDVPFLPADIFKEKNLVSIDQKNIYKTLFSSGTSGKRSKIFLDKTNAFRQKQVLLSIASEFLGNDRKPMLSILKKEENSNILSAAKVASLGFSIFSKDHCLIDDTSLNSLNRIKQFLKKFSNEEIIIFGFTSTLWDFFSNNKNFLRKLPKATILHGGGWKKLENKKISKKKFNNFFHSNFSLRKIVNYYGMVEQTGSIFFECEAGYLHCSIYSDIIIRDNNFEICEINQKGLVQLMSVLPTSYPGHSILTQDEGFLLGVDNCKCGRLGKYFLITGRIKQSEIRGCSDTI